MRACRKHSLYIKDGGSNLDQIVTHWLVKVKPRRLELKHHHKWTDSSLEPRVAIRGTADAVKASDATG